MRIDVLLDVKTTLGEGPLWDAEQERLLLHRQLRRTRLPHDGGRARATRLGRAGQDRLHGAAQGRNGAIVSLQQGFHALDFQTGDCDLIHDPEPDRPANRINDGKVDRRGRFFAGSMDTMEEGPYALSTGSIPTSRSIRSIRTSSAPTPVLCAGRQTFYFADTWTGEIWAYDFDVETGAITNRRTFATVDTSNGGAADGSTVDAEGCLWNALVYDGKLVRYTPDGSVERVIDMPVKKVTSVMFGGPNLDILYVTSMAKPPLPRFPGDGVQRGSLFAIHDLGIRGVPEPRFGA